MFPAQKDSGAGMDSALMWTSAWNETSAEMVLAPTWKAPTCVRATRAIAQLRTTSTAKILMNVCKGICASMGSAKILMAPSDVPVARGTSYLQLKTSVKTLTSAGTITSVRTGSAGTPRAPSSVCATRDTEHRRLETTVKISTSAWRTEVFAREATALILKDHMIALVQRASR